MLEDVGITTPKVQEQDAVYACDDGMTKKEQHEGKGEG